MDNTQQHMVEILSWTMIIIYFMCQRWMLLYIYASPLCCWLWSSGNLSKHQFFFWLLLKARQTKHKEHVYKKKKKALDDYIVPFAAWALKKQVSIYCLNAPSEQFLLDQVDQVVQQMKVMRLVVVMTREERIDALYCCFMLVVSMLS